MRADGTGSHTYQWDAENRLASVDGVAGQACQTTWTACYTYNALGQRVEKKVGSAYTEILYDGYGDVTAFHDRTTWSQLFIPSVGGRQIMKYQTSLTLFLHGNTLGSTQTITDQAGVVVQDALYYPWGQRWTYVGTLWDERFASLGQRDSEATLDPTLFRTYSSGQGRWLSPDPIGGDISNPQSLNRYAYVLNNPTNLIDPLGLNCKVTDTCGMNQGAGYNDARPFYAGGCPSFFPATCTPWNASQEAAAAETAYIQNNCIGCVTFQGNLYGQSYNQTFASFDAYADWRSSLAALPQNQTYNAYLLACQYAESSCSGTSDRVSVKLVGYNYNVQLLRNPLDVAAASGNGYSDPTSSMFHQGNDSYYIGFGGLFGIDEGHVVADPNGIEAHYDDFGPFNPLHWPGAILSIFVNTRSTAPAIPSTCSVVGGCHQ